MREARVRPPSPAAAAAAAADASAAVPVVGDAGSEMARRSIG